MKNKIFRIIEREMEVTNNEKYKIYLRQLNTFLRRSNKFNNCNYEETIMNLKETIIRRNNYCKEENEKELQKYTEYTDKIISRIKEEEEKGYDFSNYELTREKIESNFLEGTEKALSLILLDYLEEEIEKILEEIRANKK